MIRISRAVQQWFLRCWALDPWITAGFVFVVCLAIALAVTGNLF